MGPLASAKPILMTTLFLVLSLCAIARFTHAETAGPPIRSTARQMRIDLESMTAFSKMDGYLDYADKWHAGDLRAAFDHVRTKLPSPFFEKLGWRRFNGSTSEFRLERERLYEMDFKDLHSADGYLHYAEGFHKGRMSFTYDQVRAVLGPALFRELGWPKRFRFDANVYRQIRNRVLGPHSTYQGRDGYLRYADEWCNGAMHRAHRDVSAALSAEEFKKLNWGNQFPRSTAFYRDLRRKLFPKDQLNSIYKHVEGYLRLSDELFDESMLAAFVSVAGVCSRSEFEALAWGPSFQGTTQERRRARAILSDSNGHLEIARWLGQNHGLRGAAVIYFEKYGDQRDAYSSYMKARRLLRAAVTFEESADLKWDETARRDLHQNLKPGAFTCPQAFR